jgi:hypothetical protein
VLPSVDALLAVASLAALAASGVAVGDPETAALASSAENPWTWHQTSVPWQGKLSAYKSKGKVMGRLIQYLYNPQHESQILIVNIENIIGEVALNYQHSLVALGILLTGMIC